MGQSSHNLKVIDAGKGVEERELSYTIDRNVNWYSHCGKQYDFKNLKKCYNMTQQSHSQVYIQNKTWAKRIQALQSSLQHCFTIAKTWKQPKCPLTEEWLKKMWYIYMQWNICHCCLVVKSYPTLLQPHRLYPVRIL